MIVYYIKFILASYIPTTAFLYITEKYSLKYFIISATFLLLLQALINLKLFPFLSNIVYNKKIEFNRFMPIKKLGIKQVLQIMIIIYIPNLLFTKIVYFYDEITVDINVYKTILMFTLNFIRDIFFLNMIFFNSKFYLKYIKAE